MPPRPAPTTVLVVEDDPELRAMYRGALQLEGFVVLSAGDGVEALRLVQESPPGVVVLDLALPMLSGLDVQREIASHAETRAIPIIIVTGTEPEGLNPEAFACILRKPIDSDALVTAVRRCLEKGQPSET